MANFNQFKGDSFNDKPTYVRMTPTDFFPGRKTLDELTHFYSSIKRIEKNPQSIHYTANVEHDF